MQLKLAEYHHLGSKTFNQFIELGHPNEEPKKNLHPTDQSSVHIFGYFGDYIEVHSWYRSYPYEDGTPDCTTYEPRIYKKDEKDPLNRFNGLFDGRTYGEGRFVLIKDNDYTVIKKETKVINKMEITGDYVVGNLIENPELWEKVR